MNSADNLWLAYASQLQQKAAPVFDPKTQQFSLASSTLIIDLGDVDPEVANAYAYQIGDMIPAASPAYVPKSSLLTSYRAFLDSIDLKGDPNPNLDPPINKATTKLNNAQANFLSVQSAAVTAWTNYKAVDPTIAFKDYLTQFYPLWADAKSALQGAESQYDQLMTKKHGVGFDIIQDARHAAGSLGGATDITGQDKFNMAVKTGSGAIAGSVPVLPGVNPPPRASALIESFAPAYTIGGFAARYAEWQEASASGATGTTIIVTHEAAASGWANMGWTLDAQAEISEGFFNAWANNSSSSSTQTTFAMTDDFEMKIDFVGLDSFSINPGAWFSPGLIQAYKNQLVAGAPNLFGPDGSMARYPVQALIGFNPTIKISMSHGDYKSFDSQYSSESNAGFGFGPFVVGNVHHSTYSNKSSVDRDRAKATVTINPPASALPVLLGVISTIV